MPGSEVCDAAGRWDLSIVVRTSPGGVGVGVAVVDALARLALEVRRCGGQLRVHSNSAEFFELAQLTGLTKVLDVQFGSGQPRR